MANVNEPFVINGNNDKSVQVLVTETIDIERNQSVVSIALSVASSGLYGYAYFIGGDLSVDGVALVTMSQSQGSWSVTPTPQNVYCEITGSPWSRVVGRNTDGSKTITVSVDIEGYSPYARESFVVKGSVPVTLTQIPRASTIGATDTNIGSVSTISVSRKSTAYQHSIQYSFGSLSGYVTSTGGVSTSEQKFGETSIPFSVPTSFYSQIPNSKTGVCTLTCRTYSGNTQIGGATSGSFTVTASAETSSPLVSGTVKDSNEKTVAVTGNDSVMVRYMSNALCTITASERNGSSLVAKAINGTLISGNTLTVNGVSDTQIRFAAKDSRGYITDIPVRFNVVPYVLLTCVASAERTDPTSGNARLTIKGNYFSGSFGKTSNSLSINYTLNGTTVSISPTISNNTYTASADLTGLDYQNQYNISVAVVDKLSTVNTSVTVKKGIPVFDWGESDFTFHVPVHCEAGGSGFAPAGKTIMQGLGTHGWYRVGVLYVGHKQGHTATARMSIGGWYNDQNAKPAIVDIAFDYGRGYLHKVFNTLRGTHITSVRLCRIDNHRVAVDVYYGGSGSNNVYVTVYEIQGVFTANSTFVDVSANTESVIATLNMTKVQTTQTDLLWVNATPGASFPAQTVPLDLSAYDCVEVVASVSSLPNIFFGSTKVPIGQSGSASGFGSDYWFHSRNFTASSTGIDFQSGYMRDPNGKIYENWDSRSVPYKIYGIKEGQ
jgi:hypothetical protein